MALFVWCAVLTASPILWAEEAAEESEAPPAESSTVYTIQPSDTLFDIATRHGVTLEQLLTLNSDITDPDRIFTGRQLRVPEPPPPEAQPSPPAVAPQPESEVAPLVPVTCETVEAAVEENLALPTTDETPTEEEETASTDQLIYADRVDDAFEVKVREVASRLGMDPNHLMTIIHYETGGSFRPSIRNPYSQAVGLIQFLPSTARRLGTTDTALERMSAVDQLDWVERYLSHFNGRLGTLDDAYMAVLCPVAVGEPANYVLFRRGTRAYTRNPGLDRDDDGVVTKGEVTGAVHRVYENGLTELGASS